LDVAGSSPSEATSLSPTISSPSSLSSMPATSAQPLELRRSAHSNKGEFRSTK
jgi:hypothetical protein